MARNFGISGVNTPISLSGIKTEFGGPNNFSAYRRLGGFVPANERNFLLRDIYNPDPLYFLRMTQFHPAGQGYSAEYGVAERHYTSRMLCGTGSSFIFGGGANGFEAFRFGDMLPSYIGGMDQIDYAGLTAAATPKGATWAEWEAPVQGMAWIYQNDPLYYAGGDATIYLFYVFADYRASTVGYNWWSTIELYRWTGGDPLSGGTATLATTLTRPDGGTLITDGISLGVTIWIMYEPGINLSLPSVGNQFITKIYVNESAASPAPPPAPGPPIMGPNPAPPVIDPPEGSCPLCCFTPDTLITLSDMTTKRIDEIQVGDSIVVYNHDLSVNTQLNVDELITRVDRVMYEYTFANGVKLKASDDHPIYVVGKGYASINPVAEYKNMGIPKQINVDDVVMMQDGEETQIVSIEPIDYDGTVYTFGISKFYANGVLVY